ncbi:hypothetical protein llap_18325 [Limosa lapponica baueri]|uniref:Uncharacterized protein n=1 Tax=Limosa lapponica baueri TaxID=1758121 RepID=A0A2I0TC48_LIMLA|nr:hypothetical protein llap_18325 [Limosa lapponica baueri]
MKEEEKERLPWSGRGGIRTRAFRCVCEQGSFLPVFPRCTIGFPWASLAAPALLERGVYSSPPLSAWH